MTPVALIRSGWLRALTKLSRRIPLTMTRRLNPAAGFVTLLRTTRKIVHPITIQPLQSPMAQAVVMAAAIPTIVVAAVEAAIQEEAAAVIEQAASSAEAAWLPLRQLWAAQTGEVVPLVRWWTEKDRFIWEMKTARPLSDRQTFKATGFAEGLWDQDVAEFFIADRRTGTYQEYNLSPGGAWWSACFKAPRLRLKPQPEWPGFAVRTEVDWSNGGWTGRMSLPAPDLTTASVNFTSIVAGKAGRRFYSLALLGSTTPDFHRPEDWLPISASSGNGQS